MLPDIPLYKTDFTGNATSNKVTKEHYQRTAGVKNPIVALRKGPFYHRSLKLYKPDGEELIKDKDFEFYGNAKSITKYVKNQTVGIFIKLLDTDISEFYATYQVVGNFSIINMDLLDHIQSALDDDRPVYFWNVEGMPKWFPPELHNHDIRYEIHSYQDLIEQIKRINAEVFSILPDRNKVEIDHFYSTISVYIASFKAALKEYIDKHDGAIAAPYSNAHGLTAKQMELEKVDNYETATYMQILEGIRHDLHVTADLAKQVVDSYSKESDSLFKKGLIPVVRYGSNNFIPPGIDGSFEGMGGTNFNAAMGQESDGTWLMLTARNDGRSSGLYFLRNKTINADTNKWEFTAYKYIHPKATADGVTLTNIIRGSNQKFMVVGNGSRWYWTYGNGTMDPAKHTLNEIPAYTKYGPTPRIVDSTSYVIPAGYPDKVYILTPISGAEAWDNTDYRPIAFSGHENFGAGGPAQPRNSSFQGWQMWELEVSTNKWRAVVFNYKQAGKTQTIKSQLFFPFLYVLQKGYPRADMENYAEQWSLTEARWKFTKGINYWNEHWYNVPIHKYDPTKKRLAIKYFTTGYGQDNRNGTFEGTTGAFGVSLENFTPNGDEVTCNVLWGQGMDVVNDFDTTNANTRPAIQTFRDTVGVGWNGAKTIGLIADGMIYSYGTNVYGSLPAVMTRLDQRQKGSWENYDLFYKTSFSDDIGPNSTAGYNEVNPVGLSIGMHSDFYFLPANDPNQYGVCSIIDYPGVLKSMLYRRMDAMAANKSKKAPSSNFTLFGRITEGYPLSNDARLVDEDYFLSFTTVVLDESSTKKDTLLKHVLSHSTYPRNKNLGSINNTSANHLYYEEVNFNVGAQLTMNILKTTNFETLLTNVLAPKLKAYVEVTIPDVSTVNIPACYAIIPSNLELTKYSNMFLFTFTGIDSDGYIYIISAAFTITAGANDADGVYVPTNATIIGTFSNVRVSRVKDDQISRYRTEGESFDTFRSVNNMAPRNITIQQKDKSSVIIFNFCYGYSVTGNFHRPGGLVNMDETNGVTALAGYENYWTSGEFRYFPHPYYGIGPRAQPPGAAGIGTILEQTGVNDYEVIRTKKAAAGSKYFLSMNNYIEGAFTVYFKAPENIIVGGTEYTLASGYIDLYDIDPVPGNKTFYCYLTHGAEGVQYTISPTPMAETYSQALIAIIKTNADGIYEIRPQNVFTMNGYRISAERHGSTIPMATGSVSYTGQTSGWADNEADLS